MCGSEFLSFNAYCLISPYQIWFRFIFGISEIFETSILNWFMDYNNLLNLWVYIENLQRLFHSSKNGIKAFWYTIVHFLPVFGCLGDSAWNCIPTVYSVVMESSFFSNQDFSAKGVVVVVKEFKKCTPASFMWFIRSIQ